MSSSSADADVDQDKAQEDLREILSHYPGLQTEVVTFLGDRISESLTGETADVDVKVFGDQLDTLDATGQRIAGALRGTPGIADLQFKPQSGTPTFALHVDPAALVANGLKMQDVLDAVADRIFRRHRGPDLCRHPHRGRYSAAAGKGTQPARASVFHDDCQPLWPDSAVAGGARGAHRDAFQDHA